MTQICQGNGELSSFGAASVNAVLINTHQLVETICSEVKDGELVVTPETITSYTYNAAGRTLSVRRDIGAMTTTESTEYDALGRLVKQIDVLGRVTTTEYSADGLTTMVTTPAGATFVTTSNPDGSPQSISGTGQRAQQYSYDINGKNIATTVRLTNNAILSQDIVNGFGQTVVQGQPNTLGVFIYTRSEYNAKGQSLSSAQKQLISQLNSTLEGKIISVSERGLTSTQWSVYNEATKRLQYSAAPTSAITAETVMVSGFALLQEVAGEITGYQANALNQYAMLSVDDIADFIPSYDAAGNQCRVKTSTGIWAISYDAENRPTDFTSQAVDGTITTVHYEYDYMGRRATKQVTTNGSITLHQRYIYRGYLQIAALDLTRAAHPALWYITWDPTQPIATRPLAIQKDGTWYTYGWDIIKNVCEVFGPAGYIRKVYTYSPFGTISSEGDIEQPIQWSSEYNDAELGLIYYNYRHYNPTNGKWCSRDALLEKNELNLYNAFTNAVSFRFDILGLQWKQNKDTPHYYTALSQADTLQDLAKIAGGSGNDWVCLWPVKVKEKKGYPKVRECDTYDISNLNHSGISAEYLLSIDLIGSYSHIYPNIIFLDPMKAAAELARKTKEGESPFSSLVLAGHGGHAGKFKHPIPAYWDKNNLNDHRIFYLETLKALDKAPSYERARQKKGPVRCWFTKNANVVFSGCESKMIAEPFAAAFLRKTAKAKGTIKTIGTGLFRGKPTMFSDPVMDENGNVEKWNTKSDYWNSPLWVEYEGSLI